MFKNQSVAITGAAGGIGRAIAERFIAAGAHVAISDIDHARIQETGDAIGALALKCDAGSEASMVDFIDAASAANGPVDVFIANAGVGFSDGAGFLAGGADNGAWETSWQVNVMQSVYAARALLPQWIERGSGRFVITASAAGLLNQIGSASYSATKHAAVGYAEAMAIAHKDHGIDVHCLCPQYVRTNMTKDMKFSEKRAHELIEPSDVADTLFKAMEAGDFMVLPHPIVKDYIQGKAADYNAWIEGMATLRRKVPADALPLKEKE